MASTSGAQRASLERRFRAAMIGTVLASLVVATAATPVGAASRPTPSAAPVTTASAYPWAPWITDEAFYLGLLNCTRTGGWVQRDGSCTGYGSGRYSAYVPPLKRYWGVSDKVSRPYAKLLAVKAKCSHFADGDPAYRLRRAGFYVSTWGENIGCRDGYSTVRAAILASHLVFQSERSTNGGHWKNIKNARYTYVGIGIWRYNGRTRLVTDFVRP